MDAVKRPELDPTRVAASSGEYHAALGAWFLEQRRDLPWRRTRDPYAIWISEAMLQQTRVETVVPYYRRFLARFPDVVSLARAPVEEVLALWSGLGYYSRARALQAAARVIEERHDGIPPRTSADWLALPGVGRYTAAAVTSIAFSAPEPLVDGNVQRVFARLFALEGRQGSSELAAAAWSLAGALVPRPERLDPGTWNQALMELGACVCTPRAPECGRCPLAERCQGLAQGRVAELPGARQRRAMLEVELELLLVQRAGRLLVLERPRGGRMAGLLELPTREIVPRGSGIRLWLRKHPKGLMAQGEVLARLTHAITNHRIRAEVRAGRLRGAAVPAGHRWVAPEELASLALTGMTRKAAAALGIPLRTRTDAAP